MTRATTVRLTDEDRKILDQLRRLTGLESTSQLLRLAIRESHAAHAAPMAMRSGALPRV
jgi:hypothetical protein